MCKSESESIRQANRYEMAQQKCATVIEQIQQFPQRQTTMNKENTILFTGGHGKRQEEIEPQDKKVLLEKGQITNKVNRMEEPGSPLGAALLKRKREFQSRASKPLESIALFSCENCSDS